MPPFKPFNSFGARVELTQSLLNADRYANYRLAKLEHAIAKMDYEVVYQDILDRAVNLYFTQLRDLNQKKIIEGDIVRSRDLLQQSELLDIQFCKAASFSDALVWLL